MNELVGMGHEYVGRIDERMLRIIVNITTPGGSTGTGFIVNTDKNFFLVTNKHMIGDYSLVDPFVLFDWVTVFFYPANPTKSIKHQISLKDKAGEILAGVKIHPRHEIDVAVIDITSVYEENPEIARNYVGTGFLIPIGEIHKEAFLGFGSQVFTIGYPAGLRLETSNYPIAKAGFIASSLSGNIEIAAEVKNRYGLSTIEKLATKFFLVDGLIIGGNSGGPVVCPKDFYQSVSKDDQLVVNYRVANLIIGIVSFGWPNTGLTVIYPCDYILELINAH